MTDIPLSRLSCNIFGYEDHLTKIYNPDGLFGLDFCILTSLHAAGFQTPQNLIVSPNVPEKEA